MSNHTYNCSFCLENTSKGKEISVTVGSSTFVGFLPLCGNCQNSTNDRGVVECVVDDIEQRFMESELKFEERESERKGEKK